MGLFNRSRTSSAGWRPSSRTKTQLQAQSAYNYSMSRYTGKLGPGNQRDSIAKFAPSIGPDLFGIPAWAGPGTGFGGYGGISGWRLDGSRTNSPGLFDSRRSREPVTRANQHTYTPQNPYGAYAYKTPRDIANQYHHGNINKKGFRPQSRGFGIVRGMSPQEQAYRFVSSMRRQGRPQNMDRY